MKITHVHIHNFRNLADIEFSISEETVPTVFVGANNIGKSNILRAIKFALIENQQLQEWDFPQSTTEENKFPGNFDVWVELTFNLTRSDLRWFERKNLVKQDGTITIRKIIEDSSINPKQEAVYQI